MCAFCSWGWSCCTVTEEELAQAPGFLAALPSSVAVLPSAGWLNHLPWDEPGCPGFGDSSFR